MTSDGKSGEERARHLFFMVAALTIILTSPLRAQEEASLGERPASPLDIAPPRQLDPIAQPVKLVRQPKKPRIIVFKAVADETEKTLAWPSSGPPNSRAADAEIARNPAIAKPADRQAAQNATVTEPTPRPLSADISAFCANIADPAREARAALQMARIAELEAGLKQRIEALEGRKAELRLLLDAQKEAEKRADDGIIAILSRMRPEAAAAQLAAADEANAAAVLAKLNPRAAGTILNEIEPAKAARITEAMAGGRQTRLAAQGATK